MWKARLRWFGHVKRTCTDALEVLRWLWMVDEGVRGGGKYWESRIGVQTRYCPV